MRVRLQILLVLAGAVGGGAGFSQPSSPPAGPAFSSPSNSRASGYRHRSFSPTDYIRQLLAMNPAEREQALNERLERDRNYLKSRYQNQPDLSPEQRARLIDDKA
ncbi:MAG: hypothetical protein HYZ36_06765, partial [Pedosphaera parvula]|nr:hypothetical protein [Pedosphaera parvula]